MKTIFFTGIAIVLFSCGGGHKTAKDIFAPLGEPLPRASQAELTQFAAGKVVFQKHFLPKDGVGKQFNLSSCQGCHEKPVVGGVASRYRNFNLVGQKKSDGSFALEGKGGIQPHYTTEAQSLVSTDIDTNVIATRNPVPMFGMGLVSQISQESILSHADENDENQDGISGKANEAPAVLLGPNLTSRFGRKAQVSSIEAFIRAPLFNHLGLTTQPLSSAQREALPFPLVFSSASTAFKQKIMSFWDLFPTVFAQGGILAASQSFDDDGVSDPEIVPTDLFNLVAFSMLLAAPQPDEPTKTSTAGKKLFESIGCNKCHVEKLSSPIGEIPLYSDLLLHDMGEDLADGIVMGKATGSEFRTQPLWGIAAVSPYLHDGRADTLTQAIEAHGGEAQNSKEKFIALGSEQQAQLIAFLESLGGKSQVTQGLLPPNASVPAEGVLGGPMRTLTNQESVAFLRGMKVFDRDVTLSGGLGPKFNGDGCRSCHSLPKLGGAGAMDVNVIRHGTVASNVFTAPSVGTILHKLNVDPSVRNEPQAGVNVFEHRQTPHVFGLGLIEDIPEATIIAQADEADANSDGISGRAHVLTDLRLGRFGWKANVPNVDEFVRDALSNELGVSVPVQSGLTFGFTSDADTAADPEISVSDIEDLALFLKLMSAPPRSSTDPAAEATGEAVFSSVGCHKCHTPQLTSQNNGAVNLYSDLLLHDVAPVGFEGIEDGSATMREFRTPPLWGLADSAPYMHDGRSSTVEEAIAAHEGEAQSVVSAYEALSLQDKTALLAFLNSL